ncbi:hypothetical protein K501DRAFT_277692 [Backusella circina FSU 941]|nr:hypothetical protein K501DRAFT_277692 [Backusella circina FSU 941]
MRTTPYFDVFEKYAISPIATHDSGDNFPISLKSFLKYLKYRALYPVTFHKYIVGLELHKLHGPSWISSVQNHPDTLALVKTIDRRLSILDPNYKSLLSKWQQVKNNQSTVKGGKKAHSVLVEKNGKKGYMVIIDVDDDLKSDEGSKNSEESTDYEDDGPLDHIFSYHVTIPIKNKYLK